MTIDADMQIIDARIEKITPTNVHLATVTANLVYKTANEFGIRIDRIIPMSQPSIIIPSLIFPRKEIHRLPNALMSRVLTEIRKAESHT